jgi:hypothetical protein
MAKTIARYGFSMLCLVVAFSVWSLDLTKGLLLNFTFDEAPGNVVKDLSGGKHDGTLLGGAKIATDVKKNGSGAIRIEAGQQQMEVKTFAALETYQDNTIAFWIYFPVPASGGWDQILAKTAPGSDRSPGLWVQTGGLGIHYRYNPGNLGFWGLGPDGDNSMFPQKEWFHVAGVTKGPELTGYVNGVKKATIAVPAAMTQGAGGLYVGKSPAYPGPAANFVMDDLAFYNRALTADEIAALKEGALLAVNPNGKLTTSWAMLRR